MLRVASIELSAGNAAGYLASRGIAATSAVELGGGVSNTVVLAETTNGRLILKQSLGKLRVSDEWLSDRDRVFREADAMRTLEPLLPAGSVPEVLFEDRPNYLFAMSAAPADAVPWKEKLMRGDADGNDTERAAQILGQLVSATWGREEYARRFGDQTVFDQLRIDPYYRTTGNRHPDLRDAFQALIAASAARRYSLVHGDFSPKNLLVWNAQMVAIDFEVVHYGDPSFDAAFLLNHLLIKSHVCSGAVRECARAFWRRLSESLPRDAHWFEDATIAHLGCLLLARVDGKSPVEYVRDDKMKSTLRALARQIIVHPPKTIEEVFA